MDKRYILVDEWLFLVLKFGIVVYDGLIARDNRDFRNREDFGKEGAKRIVQVKYNLLFPVNETMIEKWC